MVTVKPESLLYWGQSRHALPLPTHDRDASSQSSAQVPPADLDIPILGQLAPSQLPLGDALEPGPLEVVRLDAPLRGPPLRQYPLEHAAREPDDAAVFADQARFSILLRHLAPH